MERAHPPSEIPGNAGAAGGDAVAPGLRDAAEIVARADADESAADAARERYRTRNMPAIDADARIAPLLGVDERVLAVRRSVALDRRQPVLGSDLPSGVAGDLYLTSRRLVLAGRVTLSFALEEIEQAMLSGERLLLVLRGGQGLSIDAAQPRLLRVEIAAARAAARN